MFMWLKGKKVREQTSRRRPQAELVSFVAYSSTLKTGAICSPETSNPLLITRCYNQEYGTVLFKFSFSLSLILCEAYECFRNLVTSQVVDKLSTFYDSRTLNVMFTRSRNWSYEPDESNPCLQYLFLRFEVVPLPPIPHTSPSVILK
jgi:hypothetical protein